MINDNNLPDNTELQNINNYFINVETVLILKQNIKVTDFGVSASKVISSLKSENYFSAFTVDA